MARKPVFVFRGVRRQVLKKLESAFTLIQNMDAKEQDNADSVDRNPDLFVATNPLQTAMQRLQDQMYALLALKRV